jgi:transposase
MGHIGSSCGLSRYYLTDRSRTMNPYPEHLRKSIIEALEAKKASTTDIVTVYGVSPSFVEKLWRRWRETGSYAYAAKPRVGRSTRRTLKDDEAKIRAALTAHPNATLAELCELVKAAGGPSVRRYTMARELKRLKLSVTRTGPRVRTRILQADDEAKIRAIMEEHPKATRAELCAALKDAGGPSISPNTMSKALKRLKLKLRPPKGGPGRDRMLKDYEAEIRAAVSADPKVTLTKLCEVIKDAGGPNVSRSTMKRALRLLQLKLKNTVGQRKESHISTGPALGAFAQTGL